MMLRKSLETSVIYAVAAFVFRKSTNFAQLVVFRGQQWLMRQLVNRNYIMLKVVWGNCIFVFIGFLEFVDEKHRFGVTAVLPGQWLTLQFQSLAIGIDLLSLG